MIAIEIIIDNISKDKHEKREPDFEARHPPSCRRSSGGPCPRRRTFPASRLRCGARLFRCACGRRSAGSREWQDPLLQRRHKHAAGALVGDEESRGADGRCRGSGWAADTRRSGGKHAVRMERRSRKVQDHAAPPPVDDERAGLGGRQTAILSRFGKAAARRAPGRQVSIWPRPDADLRRDHAPQARRQGRRRRSAPLHRAAHPGPDRGDHPRWRQPKGPRAAVTEPRARANPAGG